MDRRRLTLPSLLAVFVCLVLALTAACRQPAPPDTDLFQQAEVLLRRGDYDRATQLYEAFLEQSPNSPLAPIAEQRLRNIDRELEAVMGRRHSPAPIYIRPDPPREEESTRATRESAWDSFDR